jgi:Kef-type K+ transport system membrane component KefB
MQLRRNLLFYVITLLVFGVGIYLVLDYGARFDATPAAPAQPAAGLLTGLRASLAQPLSVLLLQMVVIILAARAIGALFRRIGQPAVTGEMLAGILLGPSLLGLLWPEAHGFLFPATSLDTLARLSQVGVILFMFVVGAELDLQQMRHKAQAAVLVSHASIVVPFFLGAALSLLLYRQLAPDTVSFTGFALFMGIAMSITAFPVLARIIAERGLSRSPLGTIAIACAAVDDVTAWCLLAVVVAVVQAGDVSGALLTLVLAVAFVAFMLVLARPYAARLIRAELGKESHSKALVAGVLVFVFVSALFTEVIGIHALFGAFLAGVALPSNAPLRNFLRERLETFSAVFLLPLFFAFTGLRTELGLLDTANDWLLCAAVIAVAIAGKLGGSMLAARWTGMGWKDSFAIGTLMNTRGLIELIVLNIGYDLGILSPRVFTMMVIMALVTTFMTGPILAWMGYGHREASGRSSLPLGPT